VFCNETISSSVSTSRSSKSASVTSVWLNANGARNAKGSRTDSAFRFLIAVEIQSFLGRSPVHDLQEALGQYGMYRAILAESEPDRQLYLAVTDYVHDSVLSDRFGRLMVSQFNLRLLVFDDQRERISQWIEPTNTAGSSAE
jgi:hypothetical protein